MKISTRTLKVSKERKNRMKRFIKSLGLVLCLIVLIGMSGTTASKAKSKNTIKVTLTVGKTYQLKVTGTKRKQLKIYRIITVRLWNLAKDITNRLLRPVMFIS